MQMGRVVHGFLDGARTFGGNNMKTQLASRTLVVFLAVSSLVYSLVSSWIAKLNTQLIIAHLTLNDECRLACFDHRLGKNLAADLGRLGFSIELNGGGFVAWREEGWGLGRTRFVARVRVSDGRVVDYAVESNANSF